MKKIVTVLFIAALGLSGSAFAKSKMSDKEAKKMCLEEAKASGTTLKGKALRKCIHTKKTE